MHRSIHVIIGAISGLFFASKLYLVPLCLIIGGIGGYIPDFDLRFGHRKSLHNLFSVLIGVISLYLLINIFPLNLLRDNTWSLTLSFAAGWLLHICCDSLTKRGVYIFWPFSNRVYGLRIFRSDSFASTATGFIIAFILLLSWLIYSGVLEQMIKYL